jgi:hypothetical protein
MPARRFSPPWSVEEQPACFIVRDHNGQVLAYVYSKMNRAGDRRRSYCSRRRSPSFVFLTLPYYLRARLQWLRHSPSRRVLGAFLNAVESRHALSRHLVDWRGEDDQYQDVATSHFLTFPPLPWSVAFNGRSRRTLDLYTRLPMAGIDFGQCRFPPPWTVEDVLGCDLR